MSLIGKWLSKKFVSFYEEIIDALFRRITYDLFCSVEIKTATFHRLGFTFVRMCIIVKNTFAKERNFLDTFVSKVFLRSLFYFYEL